MVWKGWRIHHDSRNFTFWLNFNPIPHLSPHVVLTPGWRLSYKSVQLHNSVQNHNQILKMVPISPNTQNNMDDDQRRRQNKVDDYQMRQNLTSMIIKCGKTQHGQSSKEAAKQSGRSWNEALSETFMAGHLLLLTYSPILASMGKSEYWPAWSEFQNPLGKSEYWPAWSEFENQNTGQHDQNLKI